MGEGGRSEGSGGVACCSRRVGAGGLRRWGFVRSQAKATLWGVCELAAPGRGGFRWPRAAAIRLWRRG